jgi:hypothetical protein
MNLRHRVSALERAIATYRKVNLAIREPQETRQAFKERCERLRREHPDRLPISLDFGGREEASDGKA